MKDFHFNVGIIHTELRSARRQLLQSALREEILVTQMDITTYMIPPNKLEFNLILPCVLPYSMYP